MTGPRMTLQVKFVLRSMLSEPSREWYGLELCDLTELPAGTMYPILARLEGCGWLESRWENVAEQAAAGLCRGGITGSAGTELRQRGWHWRSPTGQSQAAARRGRRPPARSRSPVMTLPCQPGAESSQKVAEVGGDRDLRVQVLFGATGYAGAGSVLRRAYDIAAACHEGQLRLSGDPYITHPVEVALICQDLGTSPAVQRAALLHDVVIDTAYTTGQLRRDFGSEIADLVEEVTRLRPVSLLACRRGQNQAQAVGDPRVLIIKLADRLHNMRTLRFVPLAKQQRKSSPGAGMLRAARSWPRPGYSGAGTGGPGTSGPRPASRRPGVTVSARAARAPVLSRRVLAITSVLLPRAGRDRWLGEWHRRTQHAANPAPQGPVHHRDAHRHAPAGSSAPMPSHPYRSAQR